jgi:REP element-mobilizing transposase RayT
VLGPGRICAYEKLCLFSSILLHELNASRRRGVEGRYSLHAQDGGNVPDSWKNVILLKERITSSLNRNPYMPRGPRLDAPGTLHHVIVRGMEKGLVVQDDEDRADFLIRMGRLSRSCPTSIYAWAIMSNHIHVLLKSGPDGLSRFMRKLLTGYAIRYNRRHQRCGDLFQNRYKSIICQGICACCL